MTTTPDEPQEAQRAALLPEEQAAGSADPAAQAKAVLAEGEDRTLHPEATKQESSQTRPD
jgi:hypothetical protein